jgi:hypothetical protein
MVKPIVSGWVHAKERVWRSIHREPMMFRIKMMIARICMQDLSMSQF